MKKLFLSLAAAATLATAAPDPNFHIYIAYGQSNMGGAADAGPEEKVEHPRFKIFASQACPSKGRTTVGEVYPAVTALFNCGNSISVADWFGRTMADSLPDVTIGIVPVAIGGAAIKMFDQDLYADYLTTAESWLVNYAKEYEPNGNVPKAIIDLAKKAQEKGVIKGFIFHQGESDWNNPDWPKMVKKTRDDFLKALNLSADTVAFVAGELLRDGGCCYNERVSKLSDIMENTGYASSEGLKGKGDNYHFDHDSYVEFGKRYAKSMLKLINRAPVVPVPQEPFKGTPFAIPGKIQMEDFDIPGVGSGNDSYKDNDSENHGDSDYREGTGVDLYKKGENIVVGYNQAGEWLEYTVEVAETREYTMIAAVASANATSSFKLSMDGKDITDTIKVPQASSGDNNYDEYNKVTAKVNLTEGKHLLRFTVTGDWMDIDYIEFTSAANELQPPEDSDNKPILASSNLQLLNANGTYHVFDMSGKSIGNVEVNGNSFEESLKQAGFSKGMYILKGIRSGTPQLVKVQK